MIYDIDIAKQVAKSLLQLTQLFYNQMILLNGQDGILLYIVTTEKHYLFPEIRTFIRTSLASVVNNHYKGQM